MKGYEVDSAWEGEKGVIEKVTHELGLRTRGEAPQAEGREYAQLKRTRVVWRAVRASGRRACLLTWEWRWKRFTRLSGSTLGKTVYHPE